MVSATMASSAPAANPWAKAPECPLEGSPSTWYPSAALGYQVLGESSGHSGAFAQGFAAGALLAMVADTMLPEAYETEKGFTGSLVAIGFAISLILSTL